jgi:single-strand DNA-binding protein
LEELKLLNVVALNGRLTADPELRHTGTDIPVTSFSIAVDRSYVKPGAERQADFINIVCWRNTAEFATKYFRKGQLIAVEGSLQMRTYTDNQGVKRKAIEVLANTVHFAEPRRQSNPTGQTQGSPDVGLGASSGDNGDFVEIDGDDDLPF